MLLWPANPLPFRSLVQYLFWIGFLVLIAGCTDQPTGDVFRFGLTSAPENFDPRFATDATSARINRLLYARLVDFDKSANPIPSLAKWSRQSPTHYRFLLKDHARTFHNGSRLTARDVRATYQFILDPIHGSPHRQTLRVINRIETPTDDVIDFFLSRPEPLFPSYLIIGILPANLIRAQHPFHELPIGSGPFEFVSRPDETRVQLMRQTDDQIIEFLRVPDPTVRTLKLLAGEIDMLQNDLPPELVSYLAQDKRVKIQRRSGTNFSYLGFNLEDPIVGREEVRKAIAYGVNREIIIRYVLGRSARPANALVPPEHWAGHSTLTGYSYDPEQARRYLKQAGFDQQHPATVTYKTSSDPFRLRLATILQYQLKQIGIHITIQSHDWGTFYGDIKAGRFQMYSLAWVGVKTPDIFHYAFHSKSVPPEGANRGRFSNSTVDRLIDQAEAIEDVEKKIHLYQRLQEHLLDALPYVPLWYEDHVFVAHQSMTGYTLAPDGNYDGLLFVKRHP